MASFARTLDSAIAAKRAKLRGNAGVGACGACYTSEVILPARGSAAACACCHDVSPDANARPARCSVGHSSSFLTFVAQPYIKPTDPDVGHVWKRPLECYEAICTITSISTVILLGKEAMPTADRA